MIRDERWRVVAASEYSSRRDARQGSTEAAASLSLVIPSNPSCRPPFAKDKAGLLEGSLPLYLVDTYPEDPAEGRNE